MIAPDPAARSSGGRDPAWYGITTTPRDPGGTVASSSSTEPSAGRVVTCRSQAYRLPAPEKAAPLTTRRSSTR